MIEAKVGNLYRSFGRHKVLKNVSFSIQDHGIVGFIGPNRAEKSTMMKYMTPLMYPTSGQVVVEGHDLMKGWGLALQYISATIEAPGLSPTLSGYEDLQYLVRLGHVDQKRIEEIATFARLHRNLDERTGQYPMGMGQRLDLEITMLGHPKFLILNEPTNGLDPKGIMELRQELRQLADDEGVSILISSHQLGEIEKAADRTICISQGEIVGTPSAIHNAYIYTFYMQEKGLVKVAAIHMEDIQLERVDQGMRTHFRSEKRINAYLQELLCLRIDIMDIVKENVDIESTHREIYSDGS